jgi:hypothetical protein
LGTCGAVAELLVNIDSCRIARYWEVIHLDEKRHFWRLKNCAKSVRIEPAEEQTLQLVRLREFCLALALSPPEKLCQAA